MNGGAETYLPTPSLKRVADVSVVIPIIGGIARYVIEADNGCADLRREHWHSP